MRELIIDRIKRIGILEDDFSSNLIRWEDFYLKNGKHLSYIYINDYFGIFSDEELLDLYDSIQFIRHEYR